VEKSLDVPSHKGNTTWPLIGSVLLKCHQLCVSALCSSVCGNRLEPLFSLLLDSMARTPVCGAFTRRPTNSIGEPPYLSPRVDPWVFLVIPRTYFRANIPDDEGGFVLAYNLMMFAIVAVCLAAIHIGFDERQRRRVKRCIANLITSIKKEGGG
jgi:hypothetical protein